MENGINPPRKGTFHGSKPNTFNFNFIYIYVKEQIKRKENVTTNVARQENSNKKPILHTHTHTWFQLNWFNPPFIKQPNGVNWERIPSEVADVSATRAAVERDDTWTRDCPSRLPLSLVLLICRWRCCETSEQQQRLRNVCW